MARASWRSGDAETHATTPTASRTPAPHPRNWGNAISETMALQSPPGLLGISTNMPATVPPDISKLLASEQPAPAGLSADERKAFDQLDFFYKKGLAYADGLRTPCCLAHRRCVQGGRAPSR